jgi:cytidine deaminase
LVDLAGSVIDANTDAGPDEDGAHTMGAAVRAADGRMFVGVNLYHFAGGPWGLHVHRGVGVRRGFVIPVIMTG